MIPPSLLESWRRLPTKDRRALLLGALFLGAVAAYLLFIAPLVDRWSELQNRRAKLEEEKASYAREVKFLPKREQKIEALRGEYQSLRGRFQIMYDKTQDQSQIINALVSYGLNASVKIKSIRVLEQQRLAGFVASPHELIAQGSFQNIQLFLYLIRTSEELFVVSDLELRSLNQEVQVRLRLSRIALEPESVNEAAPTRARVFSIALDPWPGHAPYYIASAKGWLEQDGVRVTILDHMFSDLEEPLLQSGDLKAASLPLQDLISLRAKGVNLRAVSLIDWTSGDEGLVVGASSKLREVADLKGKTVYTELGSAGHYLLFRALELNGLRLADMQVEHMSQLLAFRSLNAELVQAAVLWDPFLNQIVEDKRGRLLFSSDRIPWETVDVLAVNASALEGPDEKATALLVAAYRRGLAWWRENSEEGDRIVAERLGLDLGQLKSSLRQLRFADATHIAAFLCRNKGASAGVDGTLRNMERFFSAYWGGAVEIPERDIADWRYLELEKLCKEQ